MSWLRIFSLALTPTLSRITDLRFRKTAGRRGSVNGAYSELAAWTILAECTAMLIFLSVGTVASRS